MSNKYHHLPDGSFRNPPGSPVGAASATDMWRFLWKQLVGKTRIQIPPDHALPKATVLKQLAETPVPSITWLGHAAFIIRVGGKTVLTDPYLQRTAGPLGVGPKRFVDSPLSAEELPQADLMLLSHNHYDHLDARMVDAYPYKSETQVIVPLGLGAFFTRRGYQKVLEQDWWDTWGMDDFRITTLPAVHFSGRGLGDGNRTLWASFAIDSGQQKLWFSGDTARGEVFREIGRRMGGFDYALIAIGAYEPQVIMQNVHITPEEAVEITRTIAAKKAIGMHWGTIMLTPENPFDAPVRFRQAAIAQGLGEENAVVMKIGETRLL
ncbi:MAG: MBL fold metallo-hydrolase [Thiolinea sp.]